MSDKTIYQVEVLDTITGVCKQISYPVEGIGDRKARNHVVSWQFSEGNMSCDCNLWMVFYPEWDDADLVCGDTRFRVFNIVDPDGVPVPGLF